MKTLTNFPYKHVLVLGLAKSGTAAAQLLLNSGVSVRINDLNAHKESADVLHLADQGAEIVIGSHPLHLLDGMELLVKNPGIPYNHKIVKEAERRNIPIITEIELASRLIEGPMIGVTGSNGKTTTTTLITQMLEHSQQAVQSAGNIGVVASEVAQTMSKGETLVLELSSFQLLGVQTFKPNIAVLLNIFEAHLDYHETMENYEQAKFQVFANQTADDYVVYNADDPIISRSIENAASIPVPFSVERSLPTGAWADESAVYFKTDKIIDKDDIRLVGDHNLENILAAISAAKLSGATNEGIWHVLKTFTGVKHRLQYVTTLNERYFYNDSKATNMLATQKALRAFQQPVILLAGGLDRGNDFYDLMPYLSTVKAMVTFGETADQLAETAKAAQIDIVKKVDHIEAAVNLAYDLSAPRDVILLSPACASWDQYKTFEERGDMFIQAVHKLT